MTWQIMKNSSCTIQENLSPSDVLAFWRDWYRFSAAIDSECEDIDLSFQTRIEDWQWSCDLAEVKQLGKALNALFNLSVSTEVWCEVLQPNSTLESLCQFVSAQGAKRRVIAPFKIAGIECLPAGAFCALRTAFLDAGIPVAGAKPSTPLDPLLHEHLGAVLLAASKLAPGLIPVPVSRFEKLFASAFITALFSCVGLTVMMYLVFPVNFVSQIVISEFIYFMVVFALCKNWIARNFDSDYHIEGVRTLGDFARLLLSGAPASQNF